MLSKRNIIFLSIVFLAVFLSFIISIKKIVLESNNNNIEVCIDFQKFEKICNIEGGDVYSGFQVLLKSGINSVLIHEDTLNSLSNSSHISVMNGGELLKNLRSLAIINPMIKTIVEKKSIKPNHTYIIVSDTRIHDRIYSELKIRFKDDELKTTVKTENISLENGAEAEPLYLISVNSVSDELYNLGLGFNAKTLELVNNLNFSIVLGLANSNFLTINQIDRLVENIQTVPNLSSVLIEGGVVPGYSNADSKNVDYFGKKISELSKIKAKFALVENEEILSLNSISRYLSHMTIKGHRLSSTGAPSPADLDGYALAIERFMRAVRERNVKLLIFEGINQKMLGASENLLTQNSNFLKLLVQNVKDSGFNIKSSAAIESDLATPIIIVVISWGVLVLYIIFFEYVFRMPRKISYLVLISFMAFMLIFTLKWYSSEAMTYYRQAMVFLCALIIPMVTVLYKFGHDAGERPEERNFYTLFYRSVFCLFNVVFATALLSTLIIGLLSSPGFVNGIEAYPAVRAGWILAVLFGFSLSVRTEHLTKKIKKILSEPVRIYQVVFSALILAAAAPYAILFFNKGGGALFASANFGDYSYPSRLLEKIFGVCPAYNEFLIGYPFLLLYFYLNHQKIRAFNPILITFGIFAPISMIVSICTVNYPLYLIFIKSAGGLMLGTAAGAVLCSAAQMVVNFYNREKERENEIMKENGEKAV